MKNKINLVQVALCANIPSVRVIMKEQIKQKPNKSLLNESRNVRKNSKIQRFRNPQIQLTGPTHRGVGKSTRVNLFLPWLRQSERSNNKKFACGTTHFSISRRIIKYIYVCATCILYTCYMYTILYTVWKCGYSQQSCAHMVIYALAMQIIRILPNMLLQ